MAEETNKKNKATNLVTIAVAAIGAVASLGGAYISSNQGTQASDAAELAERSARNVRGLMPVGTVISSTLSYAELCQLIGEQITFNTQNTWAPADGRGVPGSKYSNVRSTVPDLRGVFIRGLNRFYPNNDGAGDVNPLQLDPDDERQPAKFQPDATKLPNSGFRTSKNGEHYHATVQMIGNNNIDGVDSTVKKSGEHHNEQRPTGEEGNHSHLIEGGDSETRPKNVALYYYVKIN